MHTPRLVSWVGWVGSLSIWPLEFVRDLLRRQASLLRAVGGSSAPGPAVADWFGVLRAGPAAALAWPFDLARAQHAAGVQAGFQERSLLASAEFERRIDRLERLTLGPLARRV